MGKIYDLLEAKTAELKGEILSAINDFFIAKQLKEIKFTEPISLSANENGIEYLNKMTQTRVDTVVGLEDLTNADDCDSYMLHELEIDNLLWILEQIEDENYELIN